VACYGGIESGEFDEGHQSVPPILIWASRHSPQASIIRDLPTSRRDVNPEFPQDRHFTVV
jgi:hypothetical protein